MKWSLNGIFTLEMGKSLRKMISKFLVLLYPVCSPVWVYIVSWVLLLPGNPYVCLSLFFKANTLCELNVHYVSKSILLYGLFYWESTFIKILFPNANIICLYDSNIQFFIYIFCFGEYSAAANVPFCVSFWEYSSN